MPGQKALSVIHTGIPSHRQDRHCKLWSGPAKLPVPAVWVLAPEGHGCQSPGGGTQSCPQQPVRHAEVSSPHMGHTVLGFQAVNHQEFLPPSPAQVQSGQDGMEVTVLEKETLGHQLWSWGKAETGIPDVHWFKSWLFHFRSSSLLMAQESNRRWAKWSSPFTHVGDVRKPRAPAFGLAQTCQLRPHAE